MPKIRNPKIKELITEYEERYVEWLAKQSPLSLSIDKLQAANDRTEQGINDRIYERMCPFNRCGKYEIVFMEETFGYTDRRSMQMSDDGKQGSLGDLSKLIRQEIENELRERNKEDLGDTDPEDASGRPV